MNKKEFKEIFDYLDKRLIICDAVKEPINRDLDCAIKLSIAYEELQKENQQLKEQVEDLERIVGIRHKRNLILKFDKEYDEADKKKNPNRNYAGISPDAEEVYKRYYEQNEAIDEAIEILTRILDRKSFVYGDLRKVVDKLQKYKGDNNE